MNIDNIQEKIKNHRDRLLEHKLYSNIETIKDLQLSQRIIFTPFGTLCLFKSFTNKIDLYKNTMAS